MVPQHCSCLVRPGRAFPHWNIQMCNDTEWERQKGTNTSVTFKWMATHADKNTGFFSSQPSLIDNALSLWPQLLCKMWPRDGVTHDLWPSLVNFYGETIHLFLILHHLSPPIIEGGCPIDVKGGCFVLAVAPYWSTSQAYSSLCASKLCINLVNRSGYFSLYDSLYLWWSVEE